MFPGVFIALNKISGQYPGEDGFIAPGLVAKFNVRFMPDSFANYEDEIEVVSQTPETLKIRLIAERETPALTGKLTKF